MTSRPPDRIDIADGTELRSLVPDDAEAVFSAVDRNRERLRRWLPWVDATRAPADTKRFIDETLATDGREVAYGIWTREGFAGCIGLHTDPDHRSAMIGYWLDGRFEGRGLVTEASRALTDLAFRSLSINRVWLGAEPGNDRSCAVAERLGFRREGVHRQDTILHGRFRDTVIYAVLRHEWPTAPPSARWGGQDSNPRHEG